MDKRKQAIELYHVGFSIRKISKILGVAHTTVARWISKENIKQKELTEAEELEEKLKALLMHTNQEKGKSRALSLRQIYRLLEIDLRLAGINSLSSFYRVLQEFVRKEWGGWSELEKKRRPKKEHSQFHISKGKIRRERATWEIDATGFSHDGKTYFLLLVRERWSGYFLGGLVAEAKETGATHYNKAFSSLDVAKLFISLFSSYGLPAKVITDNEAILKAEIIERGLKALGVSVRRTKPYSPHQKLIERAFRDLKDWLRYYVTTHGDLNSAIEAAIEAYNRQKHKFEHFATEVVPEEIHALVEYRSVSEEEIRKAFRERYERILRNNSIQIENLKYEFYYPHPEFIRHGEAGRKKKPLKLVCYRDIENASILEVWDQNETQYLGIAHLISQPSPTLDATELREQKNKERRIERRKRKLQEELSKIQLQQQERNEGAETIDPLAIFLGSQQIQIQERQKEEEELDIFKLLGGET